MSYSVKVSGLRELARSVAKVDAATDAFMREGLLVIGEHVARDVRSVYGEYSAAGAAGVKTKLRKSGNVLVAQTLRKSRGLRRRPNFGPLMMRLAFLPAVEKNKATTEAAVEELFLSMRREW